MKKFFFSWTVLSIAVISLLLLSSCNKQGTELTPELSTTAEDQESFEEFMARTQALRTETVEAQVEYSMPELKYENGYVVFDNMEQADKL